MKLAKSQAGLELPLNDPRVVTSGQVQNSDVTQPTFILFTTMSKRKARSLYRRLLGRVIDMVITV